jgi:heme/copper-type cytochrome/quinol oxidase subunit 2
MGFLLVIFPVILSFQDSISKSIYNLIKFHDLAIVVFISVRTIVSLALLFSTLSPYFSNLNSDEPILEFIWTTIPIITLIFIVLPSLFTLYIVEDPFDFCLPVTATGKQ